MIGCNNQARNIDQGSYEFQVMRLTGSRRQVEIDERVRYRILQSDQLGVIGIDLHEIDFIVCQSADGGVAGARMVDNTIPGLQAVACPKIDRISIDFVFKYGG